MPAYSNIQLSVPSDLDFAVSSSRTVDFNLRTIRHVSRRVGSLIESFSTTAVMLIRR